MSTTIKIRRDTAARWATNNPVLSYGEFAIVTDTTPQRLKIGTGLAAFNDLPYLTIPNATQSEAGAMSAADKTKLDAVPNAQLVDVDAAFGISSLAVGMAVLATYSFSSAGDYDIINGNADGDVAMVKVDNGEAYDTGQHLHFTAGTHTVAVVFKDPTTIPHAAFANVIELKEVHIPSWVHRIGDGAFAVTSLGLVRCEAMTPPELGGNNVFASLNVSNITLLVHKVVNDMYADRAVWQNFQIENF